MTTVTRHATLALASAVLLTGLLSACGDGRPDGKAEGQGLTMEEWTEPASYSYTLESGGGEAPVGPIRITVEDHKVIEAHGLDDTGRRIHRELPDEIPTLADLLDELRRARAENAHIAEADYASDGRPERISLDWDEKTIHDEVGYIVSNYVPVAG
ncbi:DUF6174 domain-containing protein [Streptomyces mutabilis]|uniref:DUF6174 domain-containing protein n=1 Tax=Streptomyces TaxID=1883 RepID=UPI000BC39F0B|nr:MULTISPECIES: DUF6174 domain-containing protein [unclassified Streptomyces]MDN3247389.1 DUF6174 domain-containing protein [Streptomyces sp. ZSW22]MDN3255563.1 DUF6174 domain-containing protein [Streptomyces sp. MA25(2023)]MDQ0386739.1 hypothetical protein [Streptomyces sp. DSM 42143]PAK26959.1 hypothetical protein CJD44_07355 [Streptomyces sp. alain-838]